MAYFEFMYFADGEMYPIHAEMYANAESENPIRIGQIDEPMCAVYRANLGLPGANVKKFKTREEAANFMLIEAQKWLENMDLSISSWISA